MSLEQRIACYEQPYGEHHDQQYDENQRGEYGSAGTNVAPEPVLAGRLEDVTESFHGGIPLFFKNAGMGRMVHE